MEQTQENFINVRVRPRFFSSRTHAYQKKPYAPQTSTLSASATFTLNHDIALWYLACVQNMMYTEILLF